MQKDAPALQKNALNPHFKNKYISLDSLMEQILPVLNKHGFVLVQSPTTITGTDGTHAALHTELLHAPSGESVADKMLLSLDKNTPQGQGSAITYARRYALMSMLGLVADEDDDANAASGRKTSVANSEAEMKKKVFAIAKERLEKDKPTAAEVAKVFDVKPGELADKATLQAILERESAL